LTDEILSQYGHLYIHSRATNDAEAGESTQESPAIDKVNQDPSMALQDKQEGESVDEDNQEQDEGDAAEDTVEQPCRVWNDNDCNAEPERSEQSEILLTCEVCTESLEGVEQEAKTPTLTDVLIAATVSAGYAVHHGDIVHVGRIVQTSTSCASVMAGSVSCRTMGMNRSVNIWP
jgi:hypothetical protein